MDLVGKVMSLLSRFVIAFLSRSKPLWISWLQSPPAVILDPKKQEISSSIGSILDYPEDISIPLDQKNILDGRTSADHIVISLSDMEPCLIESFGTKLEALIADTFYWLIYIWNRCSEESQGGNRRWACSGILGSLQRYKEGVWGWTDKN